MLLIWTFNCANNHFSVNFHIQNNIENNTNNQFILNIAIQSVDNKINDEYKSIELNKNVLNDRIVEIAMCPRIKFNHFYIEYKINKLKYYLFKYLSF